MTFLKVLGSIFEKKIRCSKVSTVFNQTVNFRDKLTLSGYVGKLDSSKYLESQVLHNFNYVKILAHIDDVINKYYTFDVLEKELEPHNIYKEFICTKNVPNEIFNHWVDFMENFKTTQEYDDDFNELIVTKRFKKYFKVQKNPERIKLLEVQCLGIPKVDEILINNDEFYAVIEKIAYENFGDNFDLDYDGNFDEGWAVAQETQWVKYGDMSMEDKKKYKTQTGIVPGTDKAYTQTSTSDTLIYRKVDFKKIAYS